MILFVKFYNFIPFLFSSTRNDINFLLICKETDIIAILNEYSHIRAFPQIQSFTNVYETKSYIGEGTTTRVPIEHGGGSVIGIGSETFTDNTTIQSVIVSNGIEKIR